MPPKVKDLERDLRRAGFTRIPGKGSHRKYTHPSGVQVTISGGGGTDAKAYQERLVADAISRAGGRA